MQFLSLRPIASAKIEFKTKDWTLILNCSLFDQSTVTPNLYAVVH